MKCQDVRRTLSLLVDGQLALTEWAIIQGHLLECAECRKEVDRLHALAGVRSRAKHRRATVATLAGMAVVLAMAVGGAFYVYQWSWPDFAPWSSRPAPPRTAAPPEPARPVAPVPAPTPRPSPARPKAAVEATPWGTAPPSAESVPRATRPAATAEPPTEDRMPTTQARPPAVLKAPPDAEAMPTQAPSRPAPRSRP